MEVQDNPNPDEVTADPIVGPVVAKAGQSYPVRVMHMLNGMLIIGFVIEVFAETTLVLRPYVIDPDYDRVKDNIDGYEFTPYMDQIIAYSPIDLSPIPFMNTSIMSIAKPAKHLVENYTDVIRLKEAVAVSSDESLQIYSRHYVDPKVRH